MRLLADLIADNSRGLERIGRASFTSGALQSALLDQRPPLGFRRSIVPGRAPLRGRPQFALKPSQGFGRSHRVDQFDRDLIDEIASGTFEGTNVKTGGAGRDARQHRCCLAFRTRWSLNGHGTRLDPAGARYSQSPMDADGGGDGPSWNHELCCHWSILTTIQIKTCYPERDLTQVDSFFIGRLPNRTRRAQPRVRQDIGASARLPFRGRQVRRFENEPSSHTIDKRLT